MKRLSVVVLSFLFLFAVDAYGNMIGQAGLVHVSSAFVPKQGFYESAGFSYANTSDLLSASNTYQSFGSHLDFGYDFVFQKIQGLTAGLTLNGNAFALDNQTHYNFGDLWLTIKYQYDAATIMHNGRKKLVSLGALVQPRFLTNANNGFGYNTSATSYLLMFLASVNLVDLSEYSPLVIHVNLGYYDDNSIKLLDNPYLYNPDVLYGFGIRGDSRFIGALAIEGVALNNLLHPFVELYTEQASYKYYGATFTSLTSPALTQNPFYVTPGIKVELPNRLYVLAAGDIGFKTPIADVTNVNAWPYAPWDLYFEIGYKIIPGAEAAAPAQGEFINYNKESNAGRPVVYSQPAPGAEAPVSGAPVAVAPLPSSERTRYAYVDRPGMRIVTAPIYFENDRAVVLPKSYPVLNDVAQLLQNNQDIYLRIEGFTDNQGSPAYKKRLSQVRADAVRRYLMVKGVAPGRLSAAGFGGQFPIAPNNTAEGRALNNRIEFRIIKR